MFLQLAIVSLFQLGALAVFRGTPEGLNGAHSYSGCLRLYSDASKSFDGYCTGSLVEIDGLPTRKTFLSAGHCAIDSWAKSEVVFGADCVNDPGPVFEVEQRMFLFSAYIEILAWI